MKAKKKSFSHLSSEEQLSLVSSLQTTRAQLLQTSKAARRVAGRRAAKPPKPPKQIKFKSSLLESIFNQMTPEQKRYIRGG